MHLFPGPNSPLFLAMAAAAAAQLSRAELAELLSHAAEILLRKPDRSGSNGGGDFHAMPDIQTPVEPRKDAPAVVATDGGAALKLAPADLPIDIDIEAWTRELVRLGRNPDYVSRGPGQIQELRNCWGWKRTADATAEQLSSWLAEEGGCGQTQNNKLSMLNRFFKFCRDTLKTIDSNPAAGIERLQVIRGDEDGVREFTAEEMRAILARAEGHWLVACTLFATTALRRGAVFNGALCGWVRPEQACLVLPKGFLKNRKPQTIPLNRMALSVILPAIEGAHPRTPIVPISFDQDTWLGLLRRAGVEHEDASGRRAGTHSFRKGAAAAMLEAGVHLKDIKGILGHSDIRLTERVYAKTAARRELARQRVAVEILDALNPGPHGVCAPTPQKSAETPLTRPDEGLLMSAPSTPMTCARHNPARTSALAGAGKPIGVEVERLPAGEGALSSRVVESPDPRGGRATAAELSMTPRGFEPRGDSVHHGPGALAAAGLPYATGLWPNAVGGGGGAPPGFTPLRAGVDGTPEDAGGVQHSPVLANPAPPTRRYAGISVTPRRDGELATVAQPGRAPGNPATLRGPGKPEVVGSNPPGGFADRDEGGLPGPGEVDPSGSCFCTAPATPAASTSDELRAAKVRALEQIARWIALAVLTFLGLAGAAALARSSTAPEPEPPAIATDVAPWP